MKRAAAAWLIFIALFALAGYAGMSARASEMHFQNVLTAPSAAHPFGTDSLGRDLLSRVAQGAAVSLGVAAAAVAIALLLGILIGAVSGYYGAWTDRALMGFVDVMLCFPTFFLILAVIAILGPGLFNIMVIIGATSWMGTARLVRAEVMSLKEREYILAARSMGARDGWILVKHLVPNAMGPVIVNAVLSISSAILAETGLSFLGIGVEPPTPSWGNILMEGRAALGVAWWATVIPGVFIFLTVMSANVLGEELHARRTRS